LGVLTSSTETHFHGDKHISFGEALGFFELFSGEPFMFCVESDFLLLAIFMETPFCGTGWDSLTITFREVSDSSDPLSSDNSEFGNLLSSELLE